MGPKSFLIQFVSLFNRFLFADFMNATAFLSMWISNMATAGIILLKSYACVTGNKNTVPAETFRRGSDTIRSLKQIYINDIS